MIAASTRAAFGFGSSGKGRLRAKIWWAAGRRRADRSGRRRRDSPAPRSRKSPGSLLDLPRPLGQALGLRRIAEPRLEIGEDREGVEPERVDLRRLAGRRVGEQAVRVRPDAERRALVVPVDDLAQGGEERLAGERLVLVACRYFQAATNSQSEASAEV